MASFEGVITRIIFRNRQNHYTVAKVNTTGGEPEVTVVGYLPSLLEGEQFTGEGKWIDHPRYGKQFQLETYETLVPVTNRGLEKYLGSGAVRGIGPSLARSLVGHFGPETLDILENSPDRLTEVDGIGPARAKAVSEAFAERRAQRNILIFLREHELPAGLANRILRVYGPQAVSVLRENPYRLADDLHGVGFRTADKLALKLSIEPGSLQRLKAGLVYVLKELAGAGHTFSPREDLLTRAADLLGAGILSLEKALDSVDGDGALVVEGEGPEARVYLSALHRAEIAVTARLLDLLGHIGSPELPPADEALNRFESESRLKLTPDQRSALERLRTSPVAVITGGPGTGKTTLIKAVLDLLESAGLRVELAAPTGRAAKRLTEATGHRARTIHRLLEYFFLEGRGGGFQRDETRPLETDCLIVDEVSMVDLELMHSLLRALPLPCRLILVGDADQLPSVSAGNVLHDLIASGTLEVIRLDKIHRQAAGSTIVRNAHRINRGIFPLLGEDRHDFLFIEEEDPLNIQRIVQELVSMRLPALGAWDPFEDIQVLTPMRKTPVGVQALNPLLQALLNPPGPGKLQVIQGDRILRVGDKVMQVRNSYDHGVFNGDLGRIRSFDPETGELRVAFPEPDGMREVRYENNETDQLTLAYAVSVHKSQGSEYPVVVLPVCTQHYVMLQRNLLYTAVTRARKMVVLVGTRKAIWLCVRGKQTGRRLSYLGDRLQQVQGRIIVNKKELNYV
ncbi:MAG: ATP-dependent RecD-like DNA helicase [Firmicutes bacterium]|nr:ATP-dependent RecD-like DNA helicase [Bacillota bacterium]